MEENILEEKPLITKSYAVLRQKRAVRKARSKGGEDDGFKNEKHMDMLAFNEGAEAAFVRLVAGMIEKNGGKPVDVGRVIQKAAFKLNVSTMTAKRYLVKHSDDEAELRVWGKYVMMNPEFEAEEVGDE